MTCQFKVSNLWSHVMNNLEHKKTQLDLNFDRGIQTNQSREDIFSLTIDSKASSELKQKLLTLPSPYGANYENFMLEIFPIIAGLPQQVLQSIMSFRYDPQVSGAMLIRNFPVDPVIPETPPHGKQPKNKRTYLSEACLLGVAQLLGLVFHYKNETFGEPLQNVSPVKGHETELSSLGSKTEFLFHNDNGYLEHPPHYNIILCLRPDQNHEAATFIAEPYDSYKYLTPEDIRELRKPQFKIRFPMSFRHMHGNKEHWSEARPILSGPHNSPDVCLKLGDMMALTPQGEKALESFSLALKMPSVIKYVYLKPGEMLFIDNRKVVHGRTPFRAQFDGKDRWLQRVFIRTDLWTSRSSTYIGSNLFRKADLKEGRRKMAG